MEFTSFYMS